MHNRGRQAAELYRTLVAQRSQKMVLAHYGLDKEAGILTDLRQEASRRSRKWALRAVMTMAGHADPAAQASHAAAQAAKMNFLTRAGKLDQKQRQTYLADHMKRLALTAEKTGAVASHEKQVRRAMQALQGEHDFHGSGNLAAIVNAGGLQAGHRNTFGKGVYYTQDAPAWEYWSNTLAHGPREGGVIAPRSISQSEPAAMFKSRPGAYRIGPDAPLSREMTLVADAAKPSARAALGEAQRRFRVRPMTTDALAEAYERLHAAKPLQHTSGYKSLVSAVANNPLGRVLAPVERAAYALKNLVKAAEVSGDPDSNVHKDVGTYRFNRTAETADIDDSEQYVFKAHDRKPQVTGDESGQGITFQEGVSG